MVQLKIIKWFKGLFKPAVTPISNDEEQARWEAFVKSCNDRKEKHKRNLHESATGCRVGLRWTKEEDILLINSLRPGITLFQLSEVLGRPVYGIASRMVRTLKLMYAEGRNGKHWTYHVPRDCIYAATYNKMDIDVLEALIKREWVKQSPNRFIAPKWWSEQNIVKIR